MTASPRELQLSAVLLDIEGTTTPISFVYDVLFPYARAHAKSFLERKFSSQEVLADVQRLRDEHADDVRKGLDPPEVQDSPAEVRVDSLVSYIHWLMDRDRKTTPLKLLQGKIWEDGYHSGELRSQVFEDVPSAFQRWQRQGRKIFIYSSGSVLAQKLLFGHTTAGDLRNLISGYFDTHVGPKAELASYRRIAAEAGRAASEILFISDVTGELDAAASAGMGTLLAIRPGNHPQSANQSHRVICTFDNVFP